jgi:ribosome-binding protein aMBF1 (putative translation factor)
MAAFSASFQCDECGRTFPGRKQQSKVDGVEKCPDCYDGDSSGEDDEDEDDDQYSDGFVRNRKGGKRHEKVGGHPWDKT